ncbi:25706_t:CDS:2 [Gigaspora rosea]|nr:25706_t:CDS:2 [Gigaspora rosea]
MHRYATNHITKKPPAISNLVDPEYLMFIVKKVPSPYPKFCCALFEIGIPLSYPILSAPVWSKIY